MAFKTVLVQVEEETEVISSSGILFHDQFVLTTSNILQNHLNKNFDLDIAKFEKLKISVTYPNAKRKGLYVVKKARIIKAYCSQNIIEANEGLFKEWALDSIDNRSCSNKALSVFIFLQVESNTELEDLHHILYNWWNEIKAIEVSKADELDFITVPFGNKAFFYTLNRGIVSNLFGQIGVILSDCCTAPGCEGSPVYKTKSSKKAPFGMILSSISWWRGECLGITLIADLRFLLAKLLQIDWISAGGASLTLPVLAAAEFSLVQLYSGRCRGTAIVLSSEKGIFLSNSHVIDNNFDIELVRYNRKIAGKLLFKTSNQNPLDIAIIKCDKTNLGLKSIKISKKASLGDNVYAAGFPIFSKEAKASYTITKGCISSINKFMIRTTCCVHPGSSGGAILDSEGGLVSVIVCNTKLDNSNVYSRINMTFPIMTVWHILEHYLKTDNKEVLSELEALFQAGKHLWDFEAKY